MPIVDVFADEDDEEPLFATEFDFLPHKGEFLALEVDAESLHLEVVEVWHRQDEDDGAFHACIRIEIN
ncbi:hypothetical protein [Novosphingobium sp. BW1]|uniref:hypothetical protein n=1 Tax=Novosphingobium sp. BW1 TaxID=2592621 RepID=UPI0011DE9BBA|nr:hypothetical protein [Novosphingobium sp. BW1]TYC92865.1 hypothetical protein FMM79_02335 [Novosphingobium sp. BW1]